MPSAIRPMLAELAPAPFDSDRHLFEPKWDGLRAVGFLGPEAAWLQSRRLRRWTVQFPEVMQALRTLGESSRAVVDGELIVPGEGGRPDFEAVLARARMQATAALQAASRRPAVYMVFDLLYLDGEDLRPRPLEVRRQRLERWASTWGRQAAALGLSPAVPARGRALFEAACRLGLEGIMAKALASPYLEGVRSPHWLKVKPFKEEEARVVGFIPSGQEGVQALALATPELVLLGLVGTGLSTAEQRRLRALLTPLVEPGPTAGLRLPGPELRLPHTFDALIWTRPAVSVRVRYLERTRDGWIRHASVMGVVD